MAKDDPGCPGWMLTFGDCMSLLLTFFVMLVSFTDFDKAKLSECLGALRGAFNLEPDVLARMTVYALEEGVEQPVLLTAEELSSVGANMPAVRQLFTDLLGDELSRAIFFRLTDEGLALVIHAAKLFEPRSAVLLPQNENIFKGLANLAVLLRNEMRVTAVVPADAEFVPECGRTAWGFSARRGQAFIRELAAVSRQGMDRFTLGVGVSGARDRVMLVDGEPVRDYVEILLVERRQEREVIPEEVVIKDRWI